MVTERVERSLTTIKEFFFNYQNGYFELPYLSNSPDIIIEFLKNMPFAKYNEAEKAIYSNNIFTEGALYYRELEEGFWVMVTEMDFKRNIAIRAFYDDAEADYYFLSHSVYTSVNTDAVDHVLPNDGWSLYKPGTAIKSFFDKGDKAISINFAFNKQWFAANIPLNSLADENSIKQYLSSNTDYITWNNIMPESGTLLNQVFDLIRQQDDVMFNKLSLKRLCLEVISCFFHAITVLHHDKDTGTLHEADKLMVKNAERILIQNLRGSFPGIETIAQQLNTSPTKLKSTFKTIINTSLYQYYQRKQMEYALDLLKNKDVSVKDIAATLGYTNPSKFSSAFKKYHQMLPSEV